MPLLSVLSLIVLFRTSKIKIVLLKRMAMKLCALDFN
jgi:hypothetical protein